MGALIDFIMSIFKTDIDNDVFDMMLDNKEDVLLFDNTIDELKKSDVKTKEITLKNGRKITVSIK